MKDVTVIRDPDLRTEIHDVPVPAYNDDQLLIRMVVSGSNPKDWKHPDPNYFNTRINQGDDIAGYVYELGKGVKGFNVGDRVAAFHQMAFTAAVGLFLNLRLPSPWERTEEKIPLLINGASSATGAFAEAQRAFVEALGIKVLDYRSPTIEQDIAQALDGRALLHVLDTVNNATSAKYLSAALKGNGEYAFTQKMDPELKATFGNTDLKHIRVGAVHDDETGVGKDFGAVWAAFFGRLLEGNRLEPHPYEVISGGLEGVEGALKRLMGRGGGVNSKFVFR